MTTPDDKLDRILISQTELKVSMATVVAEIRGLHDRGHEDRARITQLETYANASPSRTDLASRLGEIEATQETLKAFMWKAIGWLAAAGAVMTVAIDKFWR